MIGEIGATMGQRVVESVVHKFESAACVQRIDRLDRFGLVAQCANLKAQGFDHTDQVVILQHRLQRP